MPVGRRRPVEAAALLAELAAAGSDHEAMIRLGRDLAAIDADIAATEERWLELGVALESG